MCRVAVHILCDLILAVPLLVSSMQLMPGIIREQALGPLLGKALAWKGRESDL